MEPPVKNFKNLMIYTLHIPTTHTRTQSRFIDWNAPVCYSLLHFGPEMSHRSIKPPPHTHTHTGAAGWTMGKRWARSRSTEWKTWSSYLSSFRWSSSVERRVCVCVEREEARWQRDKHCNWGGSERQADIDWRHWAFGCCHGNILACCRVNRCLLLS